MSHGRSQVRVGRAETETETETETNTAAGLGLGLGSLCAPQEPPSQSRAWGGIEEAQASGAQLYARCETT